MAATFAVAWRAIATAMICSGMDKMVAARAKRGLQLASSARNFCGMDDKVNLAAAFERIDDAYSPRIVGSLNDYKLMVVKARGEFVWHSHPDTDDFFLVVAGSLTIQLRDRDVELAAGDLYVVPRGVEHCPRADEEAHVLLIEPRGTPNTGDAGGPLTAEEREL